MKYNPQIHHRRSIRLKGYDYSSPGAYFVTICAQNRECLFGKIEPVVVADTQICHNNGLVESNKPVCPNWQKMILNDTGRMIEKWWIELKNKFNNIVVDEFVIMPDHFHGIIIIENGQTHGSAPVCNNENNIVRANLCVRPNIPEIIQWFKTMTTNEYIRNVKQNRWEPFGGKLWQRNYYEQIVRDEISLRRVHEYIINNPRQWQQDKLFAE